MTFPFVLAWRSVSIYLLPMLYVYVGRILGFLSRTVFHGFECFFCYQFVDTSFPVEVAMQGVDPETYDWVRLSDLRSHDGKPLCLFRDGVDPGDVQQGEGSGDCWFMSVLVGLSQHPASIRRLFVNTEINGRGKYQIKLYHTVDDKHGRASGKQFTVTIDDFIPVLKGTKIPKYARINENGEIWVILLEKAFAKIWPHEHEHKKHLRGYKSLSSDYDWLAMYHMTGDACWWYSPDKNDPKFWDALRMYTRRGALLTCSGAKDLESAEYDGEKKEIWHERWINPETGLLTRHAYAVLSVHRFSTLGLGLDQGIRLVRIHDTKARHVEWRGPWADGSKEWDEHPSIAKAVGYVPGLDGSFFMDFDDFCDQFSTCCFLNRTTKDDLVLEYHETPRHLGPLMGCLSGCASFWFLCRGARTIYLGNATSEEPPDVEARGGCCAMSIPDHIRYVHAEKYAVK